MPAVSAPRDPAEMLFEPTGELAKDYSAYCEIEDRPEREDFLEAIVVEDVPDAPANNHKTRTNIVMRNLDFCFNKRDAQPLTNAIPHCNNLAKVHFTGCGVTEFSYKQLVEAVYRSATVTSFAVDFNPNGLFREPTAGRKDRNDVFLYPAQYRGAHLRHVEPEAKEDKRPGKDAKKTAVAAAAAAAAVAAPKEEPVEKPPIPVPAGFGGILYTGIQQLSLRGNAINDKQLEALCPLLEANSELLALSLWGNAIGDDGAAMLAGALSRNRRLTALNLGHNKLSNTGLAALVAAFRTCDVSNEEALRVRQKVLPGSGGTELPPLPTYTDLALLSVQAPADDKAKKKEPGKGKGKAEGPVERPKGEFDKDCVRLDEGRVRIPGNTTLWSLNVSHNMQITSDGLASLVAVLQSRPPAMELKEVPAPDFVFPVPPPYSVGLALEHLVLEHPGLEADALAAVQAALEANIAARKSGLA